MILVQLTEDTVYFHVEVEDQFAIIDKTNGVIYVVDEHNRDLCCELKEFECTKVDMIASCGSGVNGGNNNGGGWGKGGRIKELGYTL